VVAGFLIGLESMPTDVAAGNFTALATGEVTIDRPAPPFSAMDLRSALEGLVVVLDEKAVGRVQGRRSGLYSRAEY